VDVSFASPSGALVVLVVLFPLAALVLLERRADGIRRLLGLGRPRRRTIVPTAVAIGLVGALVGVAAAQPLVTRGGRQQVRSDAEIYLVFDTSRSMLAASSADARSRFDRARAQATRLRNAFLDVPVGVASLTDRLLPHLFPTPNTGAFAATLDRAVAVDRPPPRDVRERATSYIALADAPTWNFFSEGARRRLLVVFTDGEGQPGDPAGLRAALVDQPRMEALFVHVWDEDEQVWGADRRAEPDYTTDPGSRELLAEVAAVTRGAVFDESEEGDLEADVRRRLGQGERRAAPLTVRRPRPLAPYAVAAAFLPLGFLLWRRNRA
jgi:hypothetical protein